MLQHGAQAEVWRVVLNSRNNTPPLTGIPPETGCGEVRDITAGVGDWVMGDKWVIIDGMSAKAEPQKEKQNGGAKDSLCTQSNETPIPRGHTSGWPGGIPVAGSPDRYTQS